MTRIALLQLCASDDPAENVKATSRLLGDAASEGAQLIVTPEVTNCVSASRTHQHSILQHERSDPTLQAMQEQAAKHGVWVLIGSLALKSDDPDGRFVNRSILIAPDGLVSARYDKAHMFDVAVSESETYRESAGYRPGADLVVQDTSVGRIGMTICYDLRFPYLYRSLAQARAQIIAVPSAFSPVTGAAHWEALLRARAIETGCFVLAPAQTGDHQASRGRARSTYGHSLAVDPWGEVLVDAGTSVGVSYLDIDLEAVNHARKRIPALSHDRAFEGP